MTSLAVGASEPPGKAFGPARDNSDPLTLIQTIAMADVPSSPFTDHVAVDVDAHRLFMTPQASKNVQVFDLNTGNFLHEIDDLDRTYVSDGEPALLRIYDGNAYRQFRKVMLVPELQRFEVSVPHIGSQGSRILVFQVAGPNPASLNQFRYRNSARKLP